MNTHDEANHEKSQFNQESSYTYNVDLQGVAASVKTAGKQCIKKMCASVVSKEKGMYYFNSLHCLQYTHSVVCGL